MPLFHRFGVAMAIFAFVPTLALPQGTDGQTVYSEDAQRAAFAYCADVFLKSLHVHKLKKANGRLFVLGSDGSGVTVSEAKALNRCADETLRGERQPE